MNQPMGQQETCRLGSSIGIKKSIPWANFCLSSISNSKPINDQTSLREPYRYGGPWWFRSSLKLYTINVVERTPKLIKLPIGPLWWWRSQHSQYVLRWGTINLSRVKAIDQVFQEWFGRLWWICQNARVWFPYELYKLWAPPISSSTTWTMQRSQLKENFVSAISPCILSTGYLKAVMSKYLMNSIIQHRRKTTRLGQLPITWLCKENPHKGVVTSLFKWTGF